METRHAPNEPPEPDPALFLSPAAVRAGRESLRLLARSLELASLDEALLSLLAKPEPERGRAVQAFREALSGGRLGPEAAAGAAEHVRAVGDALRLAAALGLGQGEARHLPAPPVSGRGNETHELRRETEVSYPWPRGLSLERAGEILESFLDGRAEHTRRSYLQDIDTLRRFLSLTTPEEAVRAFLASSPAEAHLLAHRFRAALKRHAAPGTVNRRLGVLRTLAKHARILGAIAWALEIPNERAEVLRDTRGPGDVRKVYPRLLRAIDRRPGPGSRGPGRRPGWSTSSSPWAKARDKAIVALLSLLALRRNEALSLDLEHVHLEGSAPAIEILAKGKRERERSSLPPEVRRRLAAWIKARGREPGPLFVARPWGTRAWVRIDGRCLWFILNRLGKLAGLERPLRPHGLRHAAITTALDVTGGDLRAVQRFSRHVNVQHLVRYDDNREDLGGAVARRLGKAVGGSGKAPRRKKAPSERGKPSRKRRGA